MAALLPRGAFLKDISAWYNADTAPRWMRAGHRLPAGTWALIIAEDGAVKFQLEGKRGIVTASPKTPAIIAPETRFQYESAGGSARFCLHYYHEALLGDAADLASQLSGGRAA